MRAALLLLLAGCTGSVSGPDAGFEGVSSDWRQVLWASDMAADGTIVGNGGFERPTSVVPEFWPSYVFGEPSGQSLTPDASTLVVFGNHPHHLEHSLFFWEESVWDFRPVLDEPMEYGFFATPRPPLISQDARYVGMSSALRLFTIDAVNQEVTVLYGDDGSAVELSWMSLDGQWLAADTRFQEPLLSPFAGDRMRLYNRDGSFETIEVLDASGEPYPESLATGVRAPVFSQDRSRLLFARSYFGEMALYLYDRDTRELTSLLDVAVTDLLARRGYPESVASIRSLDVTPDLSRVTVGMAAVRGGASGFLYDASTVVVIDTDTGQTWLASVDATGEPFGLDAPQVILRPDGAEMAYTTALVDEITGDPYFQTQSVREALWLELPLP